MAKRRKVLGLVHKPSPKDLNYCVMTRDINTPLGKVTHACLRNKGSKETNYEGTDIPWAEKQRIKNEIFGKEAVAIEVYPKESKLIDSTNMYHLWILHDFELPFGID